MRTGEQKNSGNHRLAIIIVLAVPLLFIKATWASSAFIGYSLTASLFAIALQREYPPINSGWFWKSMPLIVALHLGVIGALVALDLRVPEIHSLPRILYGFLGAIVFLEWKFALWLLQISRGPLD